MVKEQWERPPGLGGHERKHSVVLRNRLRTMTHETNSWCGALRGTRNTSEVGLGNTQIGLFPIPSELGRNCIYPHTVRRRDARRTLCTRLNPLVFKVRAFSIDPRSCLGIQPLSSPYSICSIASLTLRSGAAFSPELGSVIVGGDAEANIVMLSRNGLLARRGLLELAWLPGGLKVFVSLSISALELEAAPIADALWAGIISVSVSRLGRLGLVLRVGARPQGL
jgi:hypothetical protein